jgi:hypothetical protein
LHARVASVNEHAVSARPPTVMTEFALDAVDQGDMALRCQFPCDDQGSREPSRFRLFRPRLKLYCHRIAGSPHDEEDPVLRALCHGYIWLVRCGSLEPVMDRGQPAFASRSEIVSSFSRVAFSWKRFSCSSFATSFSPSAFALVTSPE